MASRGNRPEWLTLVCLHSGLFTRDQVEAFFGYSKSSANRFIQALIQTRISHRPIASETITDGRRVCRIFGKQIYGELEIPPIRHRRETSLEVTRRRLLSLDFVLDHPEWAWLPTEQEKVACFEQLGIKRDLLPRRGYSGHAKGHVRYFPLRMPVAMGPEAALFVYIDPGMGTRTELDSWGEAHRRLWEKLRQSGRRVEVIAVAWEQHLLDRAGRVLSSWGGRDMNEAERHVLMLRQAVADTDWDTVARHGGFDAVMAFDGVLPPDSASFAGQAAISEPLACQNTPERLLHLYPSQGTAGPAACGESGVAGSLVHPRIVRIGTATA